MLWSALTDFAGCLASAMTTVLIVEEPIKPIKDVRAAMGCEDTYECILGGVIPD